MIDNSPDNYEAARPGFRAAPRNLLLLILRGYKRCLSPIFLPSCRYVPSCSDYAVEAVDKFGAVRGAALAMWRLLRCHPFVRGGFDPVPAFRGCQVFPRTRASGATRIEPEPSVACSHITH